MLPILAPIVASLFSQGLNLLGNAVIAKGQEAIEEKLGVKLDAYTGTSEGLLKLKQLEFEHEEFLLDAAYKKAELDIQAEQIAQTNVTDRWKADMLSDSWLSKNIRPFVLMFLLAVYTLFSLGSAADILVKSAYVELLAQMLMLVMGAYFVGRTVEKVKDLSEQGKNIREGADK